MIWRTRVTENPPSLRQTLDQYLHRQPSVRKCVRREAPSSSHDLVGSNLAGVAVFSFVTTSFLPATSTLILLKVRTTAKAAKGSSVESPGLSHTTMTCLTPYVIAKICL